MGRAPTAFAGTGREVKGRGVTGRGEMGRATGRATDRAAMGRPLVVRVVDRRTTARGNGRHMTARRPTAPDGPIRAPRVRTARQNPGDDRGPGRTEAARAGRATNRGSETTDGRPRNEATGADPDHTLATAPATIRPVIGRATDRGGSGHPVSDRSEDHPAEAVQARIDHSDRGPMAGARMHAPPS